MCGNSCTGKKHRLQLVSSEAQRPDARPARSSEGREVAAVAQLRLRGHSAEPPPVGQLARDHAVSAGPKSSDRASVVSQFRLTGAIVMLYVTSVENGPPISAHPALAPTM